MLEFHSRSSVLWTNWPSTNNRLVQNIVIIIWALLQVLIHSFKLGFFFLHENICCGYILEAPRCYDRALLLSIICLGRLRLACRYIFNLWQLCQRVDSLTLWLERWIFIREDRVRIPRSARKFFRYALFLCCDFHVVRYGLVRDRSLFRRKWLHVNIDDDFLEKGECYDRALLPSIICLGRLRIAVGIYSISDNCVRESTLWLSG